jgi:L,D-peptidoglycan transpeptidase YkuD (ErfK/YbiS/YcfS/YnhG family)
MAYFKLLISKDEGAPLKTRILFSKMIRFAVITSAFFSLFACAFFPSGSKLSTSGEPLNTKKVFPETSQVLLVTDDSFLFFTSRKVYALEKHDFSWRQAMEPMNAVIGRNGFAPPGEKREGDGRTPSGTYRLGMVFGYADSVVTKMPYRQTLADDLWVDDPNAPDYNRWVKQNQTQATSYEKMRRDDDLYKYGMVIDYNSTPVMKGYGSAIFFHVWAGPESTTAGCIAVSEANILKILAWLDPSANPVILINPDLMTTGEISDEK